MYTPPKSGFSQDLCVEECLRLWPTVAYRAAAGTHKQFANRIIHQMARPEWEPGKAQLAFMRQMVAIYAPDNIAIDPDLIDRLEETAGSQIG